MAMKKKEEDFTLEDTEKEETIEDIDSEEVQTDKDSKKELSILDDLFSNIHERLNRLEAHAFRSS